MNDAAIQYTTLTVLALGLVTGIYKLHYFLEECPIPNRYCAGIPIETDDDLAAIPSGDTLELNLEGLPGDPMRVVPGEDYLKMGHGYQVWPASLALAKYMLSDTNMKGRSVMEIGAGCCGIPSLVAAAMGAESAVMTDRHKFIEAYQRRNLVNSSYKAKLSTQLVQWGPAWSMTAVPEGISVQTLLGAEIADDSHDFGGITRLADAVVAPGGEFIISQPEPEKQGEGTQMRELERWIEGDRYKLYPFLKKGPSDFKCELKTLYLDGTEMRTVNGAKALHRHTVGMYWPMKGLFYILHCTRAGGKATESFDL